MMTLAGIAMVGYWDSSWGCTLPLERLWRKVPGAWGWGSALRSPRRCGHGLTDNRGVCYMGSGCGRCLRQLDRGTSQTLDDHDPFGGDHVWKLSPPQVLNTPCGNRLLCLCDLAQTYCGPETKRTVSWDCCH
ncbi:hypothetical protein GOODEAATRI_003311 [Goodea atripinnis]|uniref:Uncharacterized protein n=1 Tax=Goodea atripinnis TaxID=208336 RepID=A0ABV0MEQ8_9TELE